MNREAEDNGNSTFADAKDTCDLVCRVPYNILQCIFCPSFCTASIQRYNVELLLQEIKLANEQLLTVMNGIESQIKPLKHELKSKIDSFRMRSNRKIGKFMTIEELIEHLDVNELRDFNDIRRCESKIISLETNLTIYCQVNEELVEHENNLESVLTDVSLSDSLAKKEYKDLFKFIDGLEIGELIKQTKDDLVSLKRVMNKKASFTKDKDYLDSTKNVIAGSRPDQPSITNTFLFSPKQESDEVQTRTLTSKSLRVAVL
jgi:hypothetical protein